MTQSGQSKRRTNRLTNNTMITKHTKGEWKPTFNSVKERGVRAVGGFICLLPRPTHYEGQDQRYEDELIEYKANAKLIASAPELLEALNKIVDAWDNPLNPSGAWDHVIHGLAKGAIKKAIL